MSWRYPRLDSVAVDLAFVNFDATPAAAEMGSTVASVVLRWGFNIPTDSVVVAGQTFTDVRSVLTVPGPFTTDQSWTIKASLGDEAVSGKTSLKFQNWGYWDVVSTAPTDSAGVRALNNKTLIDTNSKIRIGMPAYNGKRPVYCYPSRLGVVTKVKVNIPVPNTRGDVAWVPFTDLTTTSVKVTNGSGFAENYSVTIFNSLPFSGFFEIDWS